MDSKVFNGMSDASLVFATRLGFPAAFGELARRYWKAVSAVVMSVVESRESGEDIVQDAFLIALRSIKQLRNPEKFSSWIHSIAKNQALRFSSRRRRVQIRPMEEIEKRALVADEERELSVSNIYERTESIRLIHRALSELPKEFELLFRLRYWVGMTVKDIAIFLSLPESTVKWRFYKGRELLMTKFNNLGH